MASSPDERITVGLVRGLHGLRGAVRVEVLSDDPERFRPGSVLYAEGSSDPLTVASVHATKPGILVRFEELADRASVESLRDRYLEAIPGEPLSEGTWYWHQIEGLTAVTDTGEELGTVRDVMRVGGAEVYVVDGGPRGEVMIPAVRSVVTELDPDAGRFVIDAAALGLPADPEPPKPRRLTRQRRTRLERQARHSS